MKTNQSLLVNKEASKFCSSHMWQHFLTQTKHFDRECSTKFKDTETFNHDELSN